jgi:uncharacterized protein YkwD
VTTDTFSSATADGGDEWNETEIETLIHEEVNERRAARGKDNLSFSPALQEIADGHSEDMAARGYYDHQSPDGDDFTDRYAAAGYDCHVNNPDGVDSGGAENIDKTYVDKPVLVDGREVTYTTEQAAATGVVNQWMNSTEHRKILLKDYWNVEAIGIAVNGTELYATQNFC